jgi:SepF-like predicted cell division protein (DUF552 family)
MRRKNMPFNLFRKKNQPEAETPAVPPQEEPQQTAPAQPQETTETIDEQTKSSAEDLAVDEDKAQQSAASDAQEPAVPAQEEPPQEQPVAAPPVELKPETPAEPAGKTYLKAMPLKELSDAEKVKTEVKNGNIIILRVTPLAGKSIEDVKIVVNELFQFAESIGGDIARLGEERVVICPKNIRIWREKTPAPVASSSEPLPTAA